MKKTLMVVVVIFLFGFLSMQVDAATGDVVFSDGFEEGMENWRVVSIGNVTGTSEIIGTDVYSGTKSLVVQLNEQGEVVLERKNDVRVVSGKTYEISVWVKFVGPMKIQMGFNSINNNGNSLWSGVKEINAASDWTKVTFNTVVTGSVSRIMPSFVVGGKGSVLFDDFQVVEVESIVINHSMPKTLTISNDKLNVEYNTKTQLFSVLDKRNNKKWNQTIIESELLLLDAKAENNTIYLDFYLGRDNLVLKSEISLDGEEPDVAVKLSGNGDLTTPLTYPSPFSNEKNMNIILPYREGISIPVVDSITPDYRFGYSTAGLNMSFFGVTNDKYGYVYILNTPEDSQFSITHEASGIALCTSVWVSELQKFGPGRMVTISFLDVGGVTSIAKRFRQVAEKLGYTKTLSEKLKINPNIDRLVGSANMWDMSVSIDVTLDTENLGMDHIFYSYNTNIPRSDKKNDLVVSYEIAVEVENPDFSAPGPWMINKPGWDIDTVVGPNGIPEDSTVGHNFRNICPSQIMTYGLKWFDYDCANFDYGGRFIDGQIDGRECYSFDHQLTRTQSYIEANNYYRFFSEKKNLIVGTEGCIDKHVPYLAYTEGIMSTWIDGYPQFLLGVVSDPIYGVDEDVNKLLLNSDYRIPLWELVFHDCLVTYSWWGDSNNKFPDLWYKKDLFNILYGTPPMYTFTQSFWSDNLSNFKASYDRIIPVSRAVGYAEMTNFDYLTENKDVQTTKFSNGVQVIVNFGDKDFTNSDGVIVKSMDYKVYGLENLPPEPTPTPKPSPTQTPEPTPTPAPTTTSTPESTSKPTPTYESNQQAEEQLDKLGDTIKKNWVILALFLVVGIVTTIIIYMHKIPKK